MKQHATGASTFGRLVSELGPVADMKLTEERGLAGKGGATRLIPQLERSGSVSSRCSRRMRSSA